ncbi:hypothetical protein EYF80_037118 [Liparis tanakae]|uniref:Uncharacterized protein n=1 Tax=Liparis tanakae TaxID=230148 RepID=A0A4Z2GGJ6_9TELE|nr:hypothetical protein EYF80_037118 [Liparis tanakae]
MKTKGSGARACKNNLSCSTHFIPPGDSEAAPVMSCLPNAARRSEERDTQPEEEFTLTCRRTTDPDERTKRRSIAPRASTGNRMMRDYRSRAAASLQNPGQKCPAVRAGLFRVNEVVTVTASPGFTPVTLW